MERGIEIQRLRLLRLLAGWLAAVVFLSIAPIAPDWTRPFRAFLCSVLESAEAAARSLVFAQASLIARQRGGSVDADWLLRPDYAAPSRFVCDEAPSLAVLRRRLKALRRVLQDLPRHGLRLLQRMAKARRRGLASAAGATVRPQSAARVDAVNQCCLPLPWHPPEAA